MAPDRQDFVRRNQLSRLRILTRLLLITGGVLAVALIGGIALITSDSPTSAATQYTDNVGGGKNSISVESFFPNVIFLNQGDSVQFKNPYEEFHTVTFLGGGKEPDLIIPAPNSPKSGPPKLIFNPQAAFPVPPAPAPKFDSKAYLNSGILNKGDAWTVSFGDQGVFNFLCLIHPGMTGEVHVLAAGVHVPTQAQRDFEAQDQLTKALAKGEQASAAVVMGKTANSNGTSNWDVRTGPSAGQADVFRFLPSQINVGVGDTVNWTSNTGVPHTVSFLPSGADFSLILTEPQPNGPPNLVVNPQVLFPNKPSQTYDGTGYYNSGFITADPQLATGGTTFSLTFTKPGTYQYLCQLHDDQGMRGVVQVGPATAAGGILPPNTGDGGFSAASSGGGHSGLLYLLAVSFALPIVAGGAIGLRRMRA
jgi:plastocyanin